MIGSVGMRISRLFCTTAALTCALGAAAHAQDAPAQQQAVEENWELLNAYCVECHNFTDWAGGLAFDTMAPDGVPDDAEIWELAVRKLRGGLMPPAGEPRPAHAEIDAFVSSMEAYLDHSAAAHADPGHVSLHRLNRTEYENEIRRILDLDIDAAELLPQDAQIEGFSNIAEVLQVSPSFFEQYIAAARKVSLAAVGAGAPRPGAEVFTAPEGVNHTAHVEGLPLGTRGGMAVTHNFPADGVYRFNIDVASPDGYHLRSHWLEYENTLIVTVDGVRMFQVDVGGDDDRAAVDRVLSPAVTSILSRFEDIPIEVSAGPHLIGVTWIAKSLAESDVDLEILKPGVGVESIPQVKGFAFAGPYAADGRGATPSRSRIFTCHPSEGDEEAACARDIVTRLAESAFRRPVRADEADVLMGFYESAAREDGFEAGIQQAVMAMLASPKFLYRAETPPEGAEGGDAYPLGPLQLASRLSFFLWAEGPDRELIDLAAEGRLDNPRVLKAQVERMLADPRAKSLSTNFAMQWLKIGVMDSIQPDARIFPNFDVSLKGAFRTELELFIDSILRSDRSVVDLLTADHTYLNERLALHYGISDVRGPQFREVTLDGTHRRGLLGKGAVLMASSYPDRTSPVLRGAWIMDNVIGAPPAAPPPDVDAFPETVEGEAALTVRERLVSHRAIPSCNSCHGVIDPLGLALENFNAIGEWRDIDRYAGEQIDASGQLVDGSPVSGVDDLRAALTAQSEQFVQTLAEKLMIYALGRTVEYHDMPTVRAVVREAAKDDYTFSSIVTAIVLSEPFRANTAVAPDAHAVQEAAVHE